MKTGFKYFIEHKESKKWLVYDGTLTDNPNDEGLISFDEDWIAEQYLKPVPPQITSDFSGTRTNTDYIGTSMWTMLKSQIAEKNNGADLYSDFIITEHEFINSK